MSTYEELPADLGGIQMDPQCWQQEELSHEQLLQQAQQYLQDTLAEESAQKDQNEEADRLFCELYNPRPLSPTSEKYRQKQAQLTEKFEFIQQETTMLRHRVMEVRKQCSKLSRMKRTLCSLLDERGDTYYRAHIDMPDVEPYPTSNLPMVPTAPARQHHSHHNNHQQQQVEYVPAHAEVPQPLQEPVQEPRKKKSRTSRAKEIIMTPEQREEEERARQRIVSIIDSVFTETARKNALLEQEMKNKVANVAKECPAPPAVPQKRVRGPVLPQRNRSLTSSQPSGTRTLGAAPRRRALTNQLPPLPILEPAEKPFIPYRMEQVNEQAPSSSVKADDGSAKKRRRKVVTGEVAGMNYSFLSNESETDSECEEVPPSTSKQ